MSQSPVELQIQVNQSEHQFQLRPTENRNELFIGNAVPVPVKDYNQLYNRPRINGVELVGDQSTDDLHLTHPRPLTNEEIAALLTMD